MGLFKRRPIVSMPDESTADRARLKADALGSLARARALKRRSAALAADLNEHGDTNHYAERLREAYGIPT